MDNFNLDITKEQAAKIRDLFGLQLNTGSGTINQHGVEFNYVYSPEDNKLHITVIHKPFYITIDTVKDKLAEMINNATTSK